MIAIELPRFWRILKFQWSHSYRKHLFLGIHTLSPNFWSYFEFITFILGISDVFKIQFSLSFLPLLPWKHLNVQCKMLDNVLLERRYMSHSMCFRGVQNNSKTGWLTNTEAPRRQLSLLSPTQLLDFSFKSISNLFIKNRYSACI